MLVLSNEGSSFYSSLLFYLLLLFLLRPQKPGGFDIQHGISGEMNTIELVICMIW